MSSEPKRDIRDIARLPTESSSIIPKRIIQIFCPPPGQPPELPLFCRAAAANVKLLHPSFDYILFGKVEMDTFIEAEFPELKETMAMFTYPIQRFDFFRYLAVYRLGGFYLDLDIFLAHSLEPLLELGCVFPFEELTICDFLREEFGMDWEIANYGFGAAPGDPFIGAIISNCIRGLRDPNWARKMMRGIPPWFQKPFYVPTTTGPGMVSRTFAENPNLSRNIAILFPSDVCDQNSWQRFGEFGVHMMQGSWRKQDSFLLSKLRCFWERKKRKNQMRKSRRKGPRRTGDWKQFSSLIPVEQA